jgi:hypothetical protein
MNAENDEINKITTVDEFFSVVSRMSPDDRAEVVRRSGRGTPAQLDQAIANWKAKRLQ